MTSPHQSSLDRRSSQRRRRTLRGASSTLLAAIVAPMLMVMVGLVVDGGAQLAAVREAENVASQAARAGADASTSASLTGKSQAEAARAGAQEYLRRVNVPGEVTLANGTVTVRTTVTTRTMFLGLLGVHTLQGHGEASSRVVTT